MLEPKRFRRIKGKKHLPAKSWICKTWRQHTYKRLQVLVEDKKPSQIISTPLSDNYFVCRYAMAPKATKKNKHILISWWFQPIWKILQKSPIGSSPQIFRVNWVNHQTPSSWKSDSSRHNNNNSPVLPPFNNTSHDLPFDRRRPSTCRRSGNISANGESVKYLEKHMQGGPPTRYNLGYNSYK